MIEYFLWQAAGWAKTAELIDVLFSVMLPGANPNRRDSGRGLCAEEWARFCGCHNCADAIAKYIRSKKYFFRKTFFQLSKEKWTSEPDLLAGKSSTEKSRGGGGGGSSWLRHLSLKRKKPTRPGEIMDPQCLTKS